MARSAALRGDRLLALVNHSCALDRLQRYFGTGRHMGDKPFNGAYFERLAGGGDRAETASRITADDLVAVGALSVQVPTPVASRLLEEKLGQRIGALLSQIPVDVDLADDAAQALIAPRSPARQAWQLLDNEDDVGWVIAGKLMARKRPRLLPVYDSVVKCVLGWGRSFWEPLRDELRADDSQLHHRLVALRTDAGLPNEISALRTLDVVLWMWHQSQHRTRHCPGPDLSDLVAPPQPAAMDRPATEEAANGEEQCQ